MDGPALRLRSVVFDSPDPEASVGFWARLFDAPADRVEYDREWSEVRLAGEGVKLAFQRSEDYRRPEWPSGTPQQVHLDITVADLAGASARAQALGAAVLAEPFDEEGGCRFQVHADPDGHPFCFCVESPPAP